MKRRRSARAIWVELIEYLGRHGSRHCVLLRRRGRLSLAYLNDEQLLALSGPAER